MLFYFFPLQNFRNGSEWTELLNLYGPVVPVGSSQNGGTSTSNETRFSGLELQLTTVLFTPFASDLHQFFFK